MCKNVQYFFGGGHRWSVSENRRSAAAYWTLTAFIAAILAVPFWMTRFNPLVDFGGHLARSYIIANYERVPIFQEVFEKSFNPVPNMGYELFSSILIQHLDPLIVGKLFLTLYVILFCAGCHFAALALHGTRSWLAPLITFLAYNSALLYGFINYVMSLALFLLFLAGWLRSRGQWTLARLASLAILATLTYLTHLVGFICIVLSSVALMILCREQWRAFVPCLPAIAIHLWPSNRGLPSTEIVWSSWQGKLIGLGSVILSFNYLLNVAVVLVIGVVVALTLYYGRLRIAREGVLVAVLFLLCFLILPDEWRGGGSVDKRFAPPALILLGLSIAVSLPRRLAAGLMILLIVAWLARTFEIIDQWRQSSLEEEAMEPMFQPIEAGSRIIPLMHYSADRERAKRQRIHEHFVSLAILKRHSIPATFVAVADVQPVWFRHPEQFIVNPLNLASYDYVWTCGLDDGGRRALEVLATAVTSTGWCSVWKINR